MTTQKFLPPVPVHYPPYSQHQNILLLIGLYPDQTRDYYYDVLKKTLVYSPNRPQLFFHALSKFHRQGLIAYTPEPTYKLRKGDVVNCSLTPSGYEVFEYIVISRSFYRQVVINRLNLAGFPANSPPFVTALSL